MDIVADRDTASWPTEKTDGAVGYDSGSDCHPKQLGLGIESQGAWIAPKPERLLGEIAEHIGQGEAAGYGFGEQGVHYSKTLKWTISLGWMLVLMVAIA